MLPLPRFGEKCGFSVFPLNFQWLTHRQAQTDFRAKLEQSSQGSMKVLANNQHELPGWKSPCCLCLTRPSPLTIFAINDSLFTLNVVELHTCNEADIWSFHNERYRFAAFIHSLTQWLQGFMIRCIFWSWPLLPPQPKMLPQYRESHSNYLSFFWGAYTHSTYTPCRPVFAANTVKHNAKKLLNSFSTSFLRFNTLVQVGFP